MRWIVKLTVVASSVILSLVSCGEETPSRDHIPVIKAQLFALQEAVKDYDHARIDSLLSVKILDNDQSSDSLLHFVYGPNNQFAFQVFGGARIFYTHRHGVIDCYVMDSSRSQNRPIRLEYILDGENWLLYRFGPGEVEEPRD